MESQTFNILNKTAVRDMLENPPRGQRLYDAFNKGEWDLLSDNELLEVYNVVTKECGNILNALTLVIIKRDIK